MKISLCSLIGALGAIVAALFGGWDSSFVTLLIFMGADYVSGLILAGVFHKSQKTDTGALESNIGFKGICRKGMILLIVLVAHRLDLAIRTNYFRDAVIIAFIVNESISIAENAGLMGIKLPPVLAKGIDVLQKKKETEEQKYGDQ